ncbi:MAG TPA: TPM domain-containing protein [Steroidobacteraceae bacterium]|jgi:hypothetical protein
MVSIARLVRNLSATSWALRRVFDKPTLDAIVQAIEQSERTHGGEIRFAVEAGLSAWELMRGITPRERALQVFSELRVWDTEANNGVLIYVLWADHDVEIVADRGFNGRLTAEDWAAICHRMERLLGQKQYREAVLEGIRACGELIARHYPRADADELSNRPAIL